MFLIFISSIISMIVVMIRVRDYESFKQHIKEHEKSHKTKVQKTKVPKGFYISYFIGLTAVLMLITFTVANSMQISELGINLAVSLAVCLISLFVADMLWKRWKVQLYYDEDGFFINQNYFRFGNVKEIVRLDKKTHFGVMLHNGKIVKIHPSLAKELAVMIRK